jgi:hypothetical protein
MMTEDSMNSGVPHVRKTASRSGSSHMNHNIASGTGSGGVTSHNHVDVLSIEPGNSETTPLSSTTTTTTGSTTALLQHHPPVAPSALLPQSLRSSLHHHHHNHNMNNASHTATFDWYRFYDIRSMDIQSALDQMKTLLTVWNHNNSSSSGNKSQTMMIYKLAYYRKQTKNHWYRDDPTFILLQILMLFLSCITYSIAFKISILHAISFITISILFNYLLIGIVITSILREFTNRHLLTHHHHASSSSSSSRDATSTVSSTTTPTSTHIQKQQVEWLYAFDIHCNSFFPLFIVLCTYFSWRVLLLWWGINSRIVRS